MSKLPDGERGARAMMRLEAEADAWPAETPDIGRAVRAMANTAPGPFRDRVAAQIDAIVRQTFVEAFYRGFNAHKDLSAARSEIERGRFGFDLGGSDA